MIAPVQATQASPVQAPGRSGASPVALLTHKEEGDSLTISEAALRALEEERERRVLGLSPEGDVRPGELPERSEEARPGEAPEGREDGSLGDSRLTPEEEQQLRELQARDREVRAHEQAHKAAAGHLAPGAPSYTYERGPDGRDYAVAGEVQIAIKEGRTPEETVRNAQRIRAAALAPAEPSGADRSVASQAAQLEAQARAEMKEERAGEAGGRSGEPAASEATQSSGREREERAAAYAEVVEAMPGELLGGLVA